MQYNKTEHNHILQALSPNSPLWKLYHRRPKTISHPPIRTSTSLKRPAKSLMQIFPLLVCVAEFQATFHYFLTLTPLSTHTIPLVSLGLHHALFSDSTSLMTLLSQRKCAFEFCVIKHIIKVCDIFFFFSSEFRRSGSWVDQLAMRDRSITVAAAVVT